MTLETPVPRLNALDKLRLVGAGRVSFERGGCLGPFLEGGGGERGFAGGDLVIEFGVLGGAVFVWAAVVGVVFVVFRVVGGPV
jgi:hypothetical protein